MNIGPNQPSGGGRPGQGGRRRRRRGHGGAPSNQSGQPAGPRQGGGRGRPAFTGPMDHSYRQGQGSENGSRPQNGRGGGGGGQGRQGRMGRGRVPAPPKFFQHPEIEPLPVREDAATKIYAFVDDLFFNAKIQETARKLNIKVEFVKTDKEMFDKLGANGNSNPSLIIFDLNNLNSKPLPTISKLKAKLKKETAIIGFLSHLQGDLKIKAMEAGADMVVPRSAFSQNLPQLLRRHAVEDELVDPNEKGM